MKEIFEMTVVQEHDISIGCTCDGDTLISPTGNGIFSGETLRGKVVPVGMGVTCMPFPGQNNIEAVFLLETDDSAYILFEMNGYFDIEEAKEHQLVCGEYVSPEEYYYKGVANFKTSYDQYKWLERKICICTVTIMTWEKLRFNVYIV